MRLLPYCNRFALDGSIKLTKDRGNESRKPTTCAVEAERSRSIKRKPKLLLSFHFQKERRTTMEQ